MFATRRSRSDGAGRPVAERTQLLSQDFVWRFPGRLACPCAVPDVFGPHHGNGHIPKAVASNDAH